MATIQLNPKTTKKIIFSLIFLSASSLLALMFSADNPNEINKVQFSLIAVNVFSFIVFLFLVFLSAKKLIEDYKQNKLGAKLRLRMA